MASKARRLVSTVHIHQNDPDTGAVLQTVVVENRTLRKALKQYPWLQKELDKPERAHLWEDIPQDEDEDDEPTVFDAGNSGGKVTQPNPAHGGRQAGKVSAFAKAIDEGGENEGGEGIVVDPDGDDDGDDEPPAVEKPAKSGSKGDWLAYAQSKGLTIGDDAKRDDIIAAVERAES